MEDGVAEVTARAGRKSGGPKYRRLAHDLRGRIEGGEIAVGERLPTMKRLAKDYGVSLVTAFRAVQLLAEDGYVSTGNRRGGTVVTRSRASDGATTVGATMVACLLRTPRPRNEEDNFGLDMIQGVRDEVSGRGYRLVYHGLDEEDYAGRMAELMKSGDVCGAILDQKVPSSAVQALAEVGLPVVLFNRDEEAPGLSCVEPAYESAGRRAARFFAERDYPRVGFYKMPYTEPDWDESGRADYAPLIALRRGFLDGSREAGYGEDDIVLIPEPRDPRVAGNPETYLLPRKRGKDWRRLGVLTATDLNAIYLLTAVRETNLRLVEDIGVIGCMDLDAGRRSPTPPSTFHLDPHLIGATAVRELMERIESPERPPSSVRMAMEFVDRGTA